tara:strand:+ start:595 stop:2319 length:1725 start_codon:yes stop_codon:yes gene_type:complete
MTFVNYENYSKTEINPETVQSTEIEIAQTKYEFNPSIVKFNGKTVHATRRILHKESPVIWSHVNQSKSKCTGEISIYEENKLVFKQNGDIGEHFMNGWEDIKLCAYRQKLYALVNYRNENNVFKYTLFIFDKKFQILKQENLSIDDNYIDNLDQKNWNMYFDDKTLKFHIMIHPRLIGKLDMETFVVKIEKPIALIPNLANYSNNCMCKFENNNYLSIIHKQIRENDRLIYVQKFVLYNHDMQLIATSQPVKFFYTNIEFPMGIIYDSKDFSVTISLGISDCECKLISLMCDEVRNTFGSLTKVSVKDSIFPMFLHNDTDYISETINRFGCWEPELSNLVYDICKNKKPSLVIDIGANIGYYSLLCASLGHEIMAFEPMPFNNILLNMSSMYNKFNITVLSDAVSDRTSRETMNYNPSNKGGCSLREDFDTTSTNKGDHTERVCEIKCKPFNQFEIVNKKLKQYNTILFLKIDVEGHETKVFSTLIHLFESKRVLNCMIEISPDFSSSFDYSLIIFILIKLNYNVFDVNAVLQGKSDTFTKKKLVLKDFTQVCAFVESLQHRPDRQTNLLFTIS